MLNDTLKVKLRYELIIKNLIENDKRAQKLPVVTVIGNTKVDDNKVLEKARKRRNSTEPKNSSKSNLYDSRERTIEEKSNKQ